jgi:hypothetical protein
VPDRLQELQLLSIVLDGLDGLDDLYDQRFGGPVGGDRVTRAEVWLVRLLTAVGVALQGSTWETQLRDVASEVQALMRTGLTSDGLNDAALDVTDELRRAIAADV